MGLNGICTQSMISHRTSIKLHSLRPRTLRVPRSTKIRFSTRENIASDPHKSIPVGIKKICALATSIRMRDCKAIIVVGAQARHFSRPLFMYPILVGVTGLDVGGRDAGESGFVVPLAPEIDVVVVEQRAVGAVGDFALVPKVFVDRRSCGKGVAGVEAGGVKFCFVEYGCRVLGLDAQVAVDVALWDPCVCRDGAVAGLGGDERRLVGPESDSGAIVTVAGWGCTEVATGRWEEALAVAVFAILSEDHRLQAVGLCHRLEFGPPIGVVVRP